MDIKLEPGSYVVAVSGGVDSVALLDMLAKTPHLKLTVAHFDHGMREDSKKDKQLVMQLAKKYNLPFVFSEGNLGAGTSEETARKARYDFLHKVRETTKARAVITAHHQNDLIETAIINLLRGTGRKGLSSLKSDGIIIRPLLNVPKKDLVNYAIRENLRWRNDSTNDDTRYLRNYVRHKILPKFSPSDKQKLIDIVTKAKNTNSQIDEHLTSHLHLQPALKELDRHEFVMLPHDVAKEVVAEWLRRAKADNIDKKTLERIVIFAKTLNSGKQIDVDLHNIIHVQEDKLALKARER